LGIFFSDAKTILIVQSKQLGILNGIVMTVALTETEDVIRISSACKATRYEEESYFKKIRK